MKAKEVVKERLSEELRQYWIAAMEDRLLVCDEALVTGVMDLYQQAGALQLLTNATDTNGRRALDIAMPPYKKALLERVYFHKVYELGDEAHKSATCTLMLAKDHSADGRAVALKFMKQEDQFKREVSAREQGGFGECYVMGTIRTHDGDADAEFKQALKRQGLEVYQY